MADSTKKTEEPGVGIAPDVAPVVSPGADVAKAPSTPPEYNSDSEKKVGSPKAAEVDSESQQHERSGDEDPSKWEKLGPLYRHRNPIIHLILLIFATGWCIPSILLHRNDRYWVVPFLLWLTIIIPIVHHYLPARFRRPAVHLVVFALFTGWWVASLILHRKDKNWVVPFLLWLAITLRLVTFYISVKYISGPMRIVWENTVSRVVNAIPSRFRSFVGGLGAVIVMIVGSFVSEETADNTRENRAVSLFGLFFILFCFWATSAHRSRINWQTVIVGMLAQYIIGLFVLRTQVGLDIFKWIAGRAGEFLGMAKNGIAFLTNPDVAALPMFFFGVIPAIIFFISVVQVLYYLGVLQWFIQKAATFVFWAMGVSGAEAVVAAATPFIGQGESAMLVRPFVPHMTKAELHQIITCGFATISGSVLGGYILLGLNAEVLVSSCIMSIPASLAISKLRYPETEETLTAGRVVIPEDDEEKSENALHAFAKGAALGIRIAGSILASLICILSAVGLINGLLTWWGKYLNISDPDLTLQNIFSYFFYPVAFLLGVPREGGDLLKVGKLIAEKVITNEYNAFSALATQEEYQVMSIRSRLIATYAVCGFGNIGSLGIQIGILSQLAPSRGGDVAKLVVSALISGVFATLTSAAVAGLVVTTQADQIINGSA